MSNRTEVFIDGHSTYYAVKSLGFDMDYRRLLEWLEEEFDPVLRVSYYTTVMDDGDVHQDIVKLLDYLEYNGYTVIRKPIKPSDNDDRRPKRGEICVEMAVDMLLAAPRVENIVVFSGDGNLKRAIQAVKAGGCKVTVISTNEVTPKIIADDIRRHADEFVELNDHMGFFDRQSAKPLLVKK